MRIFTEDEQCGLKAGFVRETGRGKALRKKRHGLSAFTLLEVIIACAIFFLVAFSVLELVTRSLAAARSLQQREPDAGMLAGALSLTNSLIEGTESGDFEDLYTGLYPGYSWMQNVTEIYSNGLFQVDFVVYNDRKMRRGANETYMTILMFRPASPPGSASGGGFGGGFNGGFSGGASGQGTGPGNYERRGR